MRGRKEKEEGGEKSNQSKTSLGWEKPEFDSKNGTAKSKSEHAPIFDRTVRTQKAWQLFWQL